MEAPNLAETTYERVRRDIGVGVNIMLAVAGFVASAGLQWFRTDSSFRWSDLGWSALVAVATPVVAGLLYAPFVWRRHRDEARSVAAAQLVTPAALAAAKLKTTVIGGIGGMQILKKLDGLLSVSGIPTTDYHIHICNELRIDPQTDENREIARQIIQFITCVVKVAEESTRHGRNGASVVVRYSPLGKDVYWNEFKKELEEDRNAQANPQV